MEKHKNRIVGYEIEYRGERYKAVLGSPTEDQAACIGCPFITSTDLCPEDYYGNELCLPGTIRFEKVDPLYMDLKKVKEAADAVSDS